MAFLLGATSLLRSQQQILPVKLDDFNQPHGWWVYHKDGTAQNDEQALTLDNGYLRLSLKNPSNTMECNVGISEAQNIYSKAIKRLTVETRVKLLTAMQPGSRGWGLWKSRKGKGAHSLAWFMQQQVVGRPSLTWHLAGTVAGGKRQIVNWQPDLQQWHVYRIERNLINKTTFFWIDDRLVLKTAGLVPFGRLSFHLWIDNQVYSREGILRTGWSGENALIVDYVKITTDHSLPTGVMELPHPAVLFYKEWADVFTGSGVFAIEEIPFTSQSSVVYCLINARLESWSAYDTEDELLLFLDGDSVPVETLTGKVGRGQTRSFMVSLRLRPGRHVLHLKGKTSPVLYDLLLLDGSRGSLAFEKRNWSPSARETEWVVQVQKNRPLLFYAAASLNEAPGFDPFKAASDLEEKDEDLNLFLQSKDRSFSKTLSFCGNQAFGAFQSRAMVIHPQADTLHIRLKFSGQPRVHRLLLFQLR